MIQASYKFMEQENIKRKAMDVMNRLADENPGAVSQGLFDHAEQVGERTYELLRGVAQNHHVSFDQMDVIMASYLHDIGNFYGGTLFHELRGAEKMQENAWKWGIAHSGAHASALAQMIRPHGSVREMWDMPYFSENTAPYAHLDPVLLVPRTWQEAIVAAADWTVGKDGPVSAEDRARGWIAKQKEPYDDHTAAMVCSVDNAIPRVTRLCDRVERAAKGELHQQEFAVYGIL